MARPGDWVRVELAGDPWPVSMRIGDGPELAAFIDHPRTGGTFAQVRCPSLAPGVYEVVVRTPTGVIRAELEVEGDVQIVRRSAWNGPA